MLLTRKQIELVSQLEEALNKINKEIFLDNKANPYYTEQLKIQAETYAEEFSKQLNKLMEAL